MPLKYHNMTFRLLGEEPLISEEAIQKMDKWEAEHGVTLPTSVREWYSLEGVDNFLTPQNESCGPVSLDFFLQDFIESIHESKRIGPACSCFFGSRNVNTGHNGYVVFDGSDDPPISSEVGDDISKFSAYVFALCWWVISENSPSLQIRIESISPQFITALREEFEEITVPDVIDMIISGTICLLGKHETVEILPKNMRLTADSQEQLFTLFARMAFLEKKTIHLGKQTSYEAFVQRFPQEKEVYPHYKNRPHIKKNFWQRLFGL